MRIRIKIKSRENLDCVIGAVIGRIDRPEAVIAGRYTATGVLTIVGRTGPLTSVQSAAVADVVAAPATGHPWPAEISAGRFGGGKVALTRVEPTAVVEVSADPALTGNRPRHILRFVRLRPDLDPADLETVDP